MKSTDVIQPTAIKFPVAKNGTKNTIPLNATGSNLASIEEGFPDITMQSIEDGGLPPYGQDFNGLFYLATDYKAYLQDGGYITFNEVVSNLIGGYPAGAILDYYDSDTNSYTKVVSLIDDNTYNFNTTPSYIDNTHWQDVNFGGANLSLSNLIAAGENRLHALKGYLDNGALLSDSTLFNDVYSYNHSTFDLSKFTVEGSPIITEDGIASGFSSSNKVYHTVSLSGRTLIVECGFLYKLPSVGANIQALNTSGEATYARIYLNTVGTCRLYFQNASSEYLDCTVSEYSPQAGDLVVTKMILTESSTAKFEVTNTRTGITIVKTSTNAWTGTIADIKKVYAGTASTYDPFDGSLDLKQFSITVDGYPIFSGTKTGIDTIKPADYTTVGSPTISADGIASDFSTSNYITKSSAFTISSSGEFHIDFKYKGSAHTAIQYLFDAYNTSSNEIFVRREANGNYYACHVVSGGNTVFNKTIQDNSDDITGYVEYKNGTYRYNINNGTEQTTDSSTVITTGSYDMSLGVRLASGNAINPISNGSIDLNGVKAYVDGDLKYQACLLIPYNQSSTGSKIVDIAYKDRVVDVYEQYGKALYYTINETNQKAIIPLGELYGHILTASNDKQVIGDWCVTVPTTTSTATLNKPSVVIDNYVNGTNGYIKYSDGLIVQWGHDEGTADKVDLLVPFSNTDYNVQIRMNLNSGAAIQATYWYLTDKTTADFTRGTHATNASLDWLAIGY